MPVFSGSSGESVSISSLSHPSKSEPCAVESSAAVELSPGSKLFSASGNEEGAKGFRCLKGTFISVPSPSPSKTCIYAEWAKIFLILPKNQNI